MESVPRIYLLSFYAEIYSKPLAKSGKGQGAKSRKTFL